MKAPSEIQWIVCSLALTVQALAEGPPVARTQEVIGGPWRFVASDTLVGAEASDFDTNAWTEVTIPHTWQTLNDQRDAIKDAAIITVRGGRCVFTESIRP